MMKYFGYGAAIVAFLGAQFWGVPYYISGQVNAQVATEIEKRAELEGKPESVQNLEKADIEFKGRMDAFENNQKATTAELAALRSTILKYYESRLSGT